MDENIMNLLVFFVAVTAGIFLIYDMVRYMMSVHERNKNDIYLNGLHKKR